MRHTLWIAARYLLSHRTAQFTSIIGMFSVIGVTIGVAAVICVASIFLGFRELFEDLMLRVDPHIRITSRSGKFLTDPDSLTYTLTKLNGGVVAPSIDGKALALHRGALLALQVRSYDSSTLRRLDRLRGTIIVGSIPQRANDVVLGAGAAELLGVLLDDTIAVVSPEYIHQAIVGVGVPAMLYLRVCGIAVTNDRTYDNTLALMYRSSAAGLFLCQETNATAIDVFCHDRAQAEHLSQTFRTVLDERYELLTWHDLHRPMYTVMEWERVASFLLLSLIVLIAVFNIVAQLTISVTSKQRDIAVLRTIGATDKLIGRIFRIQGITIGIAGTFVGAVLGLGLCFGQQHFHWITLSTSHYIMQELPIAIDWWATAAIVGISLGSSFLASIAPARRAMNLPIAATLRFE